MRADLYLGNITVAQHDAALAAAATLAASNQTALVAKVTSDGNANIARAASAGSAKEGVPLWKTRLRR